MVPQLFDFQRKSHSIARGSNLTFISCPGVGNLLLGSLEMSHSPGTVKIINVAMSIKQLD